MSGIVAQQARLLVRRALQPLRFPPTSPVASATNMTTTLTKTFKRLGQNGDATNYISVFTDGSGLDYLEGSPG